MQTFLPYPDFQQSAAALDTARLGKQRVEALQILRALVVPGYGWQTHPAVRMWMGHVPALTLYGLAMVDEWTKRGHPDNTRASIMEFAPQAAHPDYTAKIAMPHWLGDEALHLSHRSKLVRKDPKFYENVFPDAHPEMDYLWPEPRHEFLPQEPEGEILWILRDPHDDVDPKTLTTVALPLVRGSAAAAAAAAAVAGDDYAPVFVEDGSRRPSMQPRKAAPKLKPKKPTRKRAEQEHAFSTMPGKTAVAVAFENGEKFAVGHVEGRPITLPDGRYGRNFVVTEIIERSAFANPAILQDPRVFFPVEAP